MEDFKKTNLKLIIREELDDFDWVKDIKPTNPIDDFLMNKFEEKMVGYLTMDGREGDIISREWATVEAFIHELEKLKENRFVNFLSRILLQSHVERPYPHVLEAIESYGFDVNKSEETKRLYKKFQSYNSLGSKIKRTLKKAFLKENDFDWVRDIEIDTDLTPAQFYNRYEGNLPLKFVGPQIDRGFIDIDYDGDELYLKLENGWCDLKSLFTEHDNSSSQGAYINKSLVNNLYCDEDYFELFDGVVYDWEDQVWDLITQDDELYKYIIDHINENIVGYQMVFEGEQRTLTKEDIIEWSADSDVLGEAINDLDVFEDLKLELAWAYSGAYNTVVRDNIYKSVRKSVEDYLGPADWYGNVLTFKVTKPLLESIGNEIAECWDQCKRLWDPKEHEDTYFMLNKTEEEAFEEYCGSCFDHPFDSYGYFLDFFEEYLSEEKELLNPSFDEFASDSEMLPYFKDEVYSRF